MGYPVKIKPTDTNFTVNFYRGTMSEIEREIVGERMDGDFKEVKSIVKRSETDYYWKGVRLPSDIMELLDELSNAYGLVGRIVIYNDKLAKALEEGEYVRRNARGSYGGNEKKIKELKAEIRKFWSNVDG